jgi:hypothetical protein
MKCRNDRPALNPGATELLADLEMKGVNQTTELEIGEPDVILNRKLADIKATLRMRTSPLLATPRKVTPEQSIQIFRQKRVI